MKVSENTGAITASIDVLIVIGAAVLGIMSALDANTIVSLSNISILCLMGLDQKKTRTVSRLTRLLDAKSNYDIQTVFIDDEEVHVRTVKRAA